MAVSALRREPDLQNYKEVVRTERNCRNPERRIDKSGVVPQGIATYWIELYNGTKNQVIFMGTDRF
jgi:hypothetical protein